MFGPPPPRSLPDPFFVLATVCFINDCKRPSFFFASFQEHFLGVQTQLQVLTYGSPPQVLVLHIPFHERNAGQPMHPHQAARRNAQQHSACQIQWIQQGKQPRGLSASMIHVPSSAEVMPSNCHLCLPICGTAKKANPGRLRKKMS